MPVPIEAGCRRCGRDLYLTEHIRRRSGLCPRCEWPLSPDYTELLLEESVRAERSLRELVRALRRLVGLPSNLDVTEEWREPAMVSEQALAQFRLLRAQALAALLLLGSAILAASGPAMASKST